MAICINCYRPIEKEKSDVLPDARYCIGCAKLLHDKPQQQLFLEDRPVALTSSKTVTLVVPKGVKLNGKQVKALPPVLKEQVFDDGRSTQTILRCHVKKAKKSKGKGSSVRSPAVSSSAWRYQDGEQPMEGDVIYTEHEVSDEINHLWIVDKLETNCVRCHCEGIPSWLHTFYIRHMKLLFRKEECEKVKEKLG